MTEVRAINGNYFNFDGVIVSEYRRRDELSSGWIRLGTMKMTWHQANKLQEDLRKLLTEAGVTMRDAR